MATIGEKLANIEGKLDLVLEDRDEMKKTCLSVASMKTTVDTHTRQIDSINGKAWAIALLALGSLFTIATNAWSNIKTAIDTYIK